MAPPAEQSFETHRRIVPGYHIALFGVLLINLLWRIYQVAVSFSGDAVVDLLLAAGLVGLFFYARLFALTVQDRVIRLEMRQRLERRLPDDLVGRIDELAPSQLVALRFAGDDELAEMTVWVLDEGIREQDRIKRRIRSWRADHLRV